MENSNTITLINLTDLNLTGVTKVFSATPTETAVEISGKNLLISGENMEVKKLDVDNGVVSLSGNISCIKVVTKHEKEGFFKRIFK